MCGSLVEEQSTNNVPLVLTPFIFPGSIMNRYRSSMFFTPYPMSISGSVAGLMQSWQRMRVRRRHFFPGFSASPTSAVSIKSSEDPIYARMSSKYTISLFWSDPSKGSPLNAVCENFKTSAPSRRVRLLGNKAHNLFCSPVSAFLFPLVHILLISIFAER